MSRPNHNPAPLIREPTVKGSSPVNVNQGESGRLPSTETLECSRCGHKPIEPDMEGKWCIAPRTRGRPTCTGTYGYEPQRQPWDQGGPDTRLATMGELRAAMRSIKKEAG